MQRRIRRARRITVVLGALLVAGIGQGCIRREGPPTRVLVFGIDGGTWSVLDTMFAAGELGNIKKLYDHGLHGILQSRPPALSPVVWSTIFTGRPWQEHGVKDWKTSQSTNRKVKAIWNITTDLGIETYTLNVPSTYPPEPIKGGVMSGFPLGGSTIGGNTGEVVVATTFDDVKLPPVYVYSAAKIVETMRKLELGQWSDWLDLDVRGRPSWRAAMRVFRFEPDRFYLTPVYRIDAGIQISEPAALRAEVDEEMGEPYIPEGPGWSRHAEDDTPKYLYEHLVQIAQAQTHAARMLVARPWDLFIYVDTLVDRVSHPYWAYMEPDQYEGLDAQKAARYADAVRNAYRETDRQLGEVLAAAHGHYYVVIVSDHGFHANLNKRQYIGTHDFDGIYLVSEPDMESAEGARAYIEDVAPTLLYLLGKSPSADMQGRVIPELVRIVGRPLTQVASYEDGVERGSDVPVDAKTWEQLRGLGYVDGAPPPRGDKSKRERQKKP